MNVRETVPGDDGFQSFVELFDRYRAHYGQAAHRDRSRAWLTDATTTGPMRAFLARVEGVAAGICLIAICPASLSLGSSGWSATSSSIRHDDAPAWPRPYSTRCERRPSNAAHCA